MTSFDSEKCVASVNRWIQPVIQFPCFCSSFSAAASEYSESLDLVYGYQL
jgi:hypothetical protein